MSDLDKSREKHSGKEDLRSTADFDIPICGPGTEIGHFRVEREIGHGGMGIVYLAHDTKLDRQVAIKSIPPAISDDNKVKSRFRREARLLASLNHPDIATIYDIVEGDGEASYLVLEYIPGDTLADCISRGPLSPKEALPISERIAAAFASAHKHGIVHRDLKPANIKITEEHQVKVLDFGIAKAVGSKLSEAYTTVTEPGQLIGTPAYMSPEQARGEPSDERCDIWSFGCVLYEMLTGKPPFESETASETLAGVLERKPDWSALPQSTPPNIKLLIRRCLEKDPQQRLQHIGDAALEIRETLTLPVVVPPVTVASELSKQPAALHRSIQVLIAALVLFVAAVVLFAVSLFRPMPISSGDTIKLSIPLTPSDGTKLIYPGRTPLLLSPNGKLLILDNDKDDKKRLYVRSMDTFEAEPIPGTEDAYDPFFSPDGQWLAFFTQNSSEEYFLWKLKIADDESKVLLERSQDEFWGGCWSDDDSIFFAIKHSVDPSRSTLYQLPEAGEASKSIGEKSQYPPYSYPRALPDGDGLLYGLQNNTYIFSRKTGESTKLIENANSVQYSPTGHLLFVRDHQLYAVPFDIDTLKITGPEVLMIEGICWNTYWHEPYFSISANGTLAYTPIPDTRDSLVWVDPEGNTSRVEGLTDGHYSCPRLSEDGTEVVLLMKEGRERHVWKHDLKRNISTQLTFTPQLTVCPRWIPSDESRISFGSNLDSSGIVDFQLFSMNIDGSDKPDPLVPVNFGWKRTWHSWLPDGKYMIYKEGDTERHRQWICSIGGDFEPGESVLISDSDSRIFASPVVFCPSDGRYFAYVSEKTGNEEIYIGEFLLDGFTFGGIERISSGGGTQPCWSRDGSRLFYRSPQGMIEVTIGTKPDGTIEIGESEVLFEDSRYASFVIYTNYDVSSNGCFLMVKKSPPTQINVIQNWFEELKRLAPTGKK